LVNKQTHRVVSIGYNGTPPGIPHCADDGIGCLIVNDHCIRTIHAEIQAISRLRGVFEELVAYTTGTPCINCYKALVACGVREIHCSELYIDHDRDKLVEFYNVPIYRHPVDKKKWKEFFISQLGE
jgi:dCMP deaminase